MSTKDRKDVREFAMNNLGVNPGLRKYFQVLDRDLTANDIWSTTTTTTSSTTTTTSSSTTTTTA